MFIFFEILRFIQLYAGECMLSVDQALMSIIIFCFSQIKAWLTSEVGS